MMKTTTSTFALLLALLLALCGGGAFATSPQEQTIRQAPMPHQIYSGGAAVKVHRARVEGYLDGKNGNAALLDELKQLVRECVKSLARSGVPLNPPTAWPEYMLMTRQDTYTTADRNITYSTGVSYGPNYKDCSLDGPIVSSATLASSKGVCNIDFNNKTARGQCDLGGHADAAPEPRRPMHTPAEILQRMAGNPALAAGMPAMRKAVARSRLRVRGGQRTIKGVRCTVWNEPYDVEAGINTTLCYAIGGSFLPRKAVDQDGFGGLMLESTTPQVFQLKAVDARLDTMVGNAVFVPYAQGFRINAPDGAP